MSRQTLSTNGVIKNIREQFKSYDAKLLSPTAGHGYIPGLDGLRAIAVLIVLLSHFGLSHIIPGGFGVTVFFFISGFLITRLLISEKETYGKIALKNFYIRRIIRLYPALFFMVIFTTIFYSVMGFGSPKPIEFLAALGYFTNIFQVMSHINDVEPFMPWVHLWSLAVEEHFYLLFPILMIACGLKWDRLTLALSACLILIPVWRFVTFHYLSVPGATYNYFMTDARIDNIVWGCLLTVLLHKKQSIEPFKALIGFTPFMLAVATILFCFAYRDDSFRFVWRYSLQGFALAVLMLNLFYWKMLRTAIKLLELKPITWIGKTSYGLYLWNLPIYNIVERTLGTSAACLVLMVVLNLLMTAFSYYVVEQSFLNLRKKYGSKQPQDTRVLINNVSLQTNS